MIINARLLDLEEDKDELRKQVKALQDENKNFKSQVKDFSKFREKYVEPIKMEKIQEMIIIKSTDLANRFNESNDKTEEKLTNQIEKLKENQEYIRYDIELLQNSNMTKPSTSSDDIFTDNTASKSGPYRPLWSQVSSKNVTYSRRSDPHSWGHSANMSTERSWEEVDSSNSWKDTRFEQDDDPLSSTSTIPDILLFMDSNGKFINPNWLKKIKRCQNINALLLNS